MKRQLYTIYYKVFPEIINYCFHYAIWLIVWWICVGNMFLRMRQYFTIFSYKLFVLCIVYVCYFWGGGRTHNIHSVILSAPFFFLSLFFKLCSWRVSHIVYWCVVCTAKQWKINTNQTLWCNPNILNKKVIIDEN